MVRGGGAGTRRGRSGDARPAASPGSIPRSRPCAEGQAGARHAEPGPPGVLVLGPLRSSAAAAHELLFGDFFAMLLEPGIFLDRSCATGEGDGGGH